MNILTPKIATLVNEICREQKITTTHVTGLIDYIYRHSIMEDEYHRYRGGSEDRILGLRKLTDLYIEMERKRLDEMNPENYSPIGFDQGQYTDKIHDIVKEHVLPPFYVSKMRESAKQITSMEVRNEVIDDKADKRIEALRELTDKLLVLYREENHVKITDYSFQQASG